MEVPSNHHVLRITLVLISMCAGEHLVNRVTCAVVWNLIASINQLAGNETAPNRRSNYQASVRSRKV